MIGPGHPIRALVGDEAELPCRISPGKNATGMEVGWYRPPFSRVVHLYRNGKDQDAEQAPEYRGRTELLKDSIAEGKAILRIRNVRFSDEGGFTCFFRDHSYQEEAAMELKVEGESVKVICNMTWGVVDLSPSAFNHSTKVFQPKHVTSEIISSKQGLLCSGCWLFCYLNWERNWNESQCSWIRKEH